MDSASNAVVLLDNHVHRRCRTDRTRDAQLGDIFGPIGEDNGSMQRSGFAAFEEVFPVLNTIVLSSSASYQTGAASGPPPARTVV